MTKFITQVLALALWAMAAQVQAQPIELQKDAPDKYVVVKGDTLWDIAGRFLQKPWRWPEIWQLNREQIRDPHLIYPGDIVYLDKSGSSPRLRLARAVDSGRPVPAPTSSASAAQPAATQTAERVERASPRVRRDAIEALAVQTIDAQAIEPFLSRSLVVDEKALESNPRIVATQDGRVYLARGDLAYVRGLKDESIRDWQVYRNVRALLDPDTRLPIAWEAQFIGLARLERGGDPAAFRVVSANEEIGTGDRLLPAERVSPVNYVPRPPEGPVSGRIVSVHRGVAQAGRNSIVALNVGSGAGLAVGNVLAIKERSRTAQDREAKDKKDRDVRLPGEPVGHLLVFRVFDKISYGLIMRSSRDAAVGDEVTNP
ncbi:MAG: LysM peptidoglycan-binding domain-containing protein [Burkholderiaceae bacterium]|nr:LysM peptidoglycan-binding domain-containing protein [Burkholderiaceae bacterium]